MESKHWTEVGGKIYGEVEGVSQKIKKTSRSGREQYGDVEDKTLDQRWWRERTSEK